MVIRSSQYIISSPEYTKCPEPDRPEYAFIGRSNVGKSSLINMITNSTKLAKTSASPGKTQLINHFGIESSPTNKAEIIHWYIVDLPGYGFAKVSQSQREKWKKMIADYLRKRKNLVHVFVLIDSRHSPQQLDLDFVNQLGEWQIPFSLVFTKSDKENQRTVNTNVKSFLNALRDTWQFLPQQIITSTIKRTGREKILQLIEEMNTEWLSGEGE
ncbi:MAG TPA: ribosome biogenesis GTP-binding protein YihA/YsxC [Puia sp.]|nr:ribosome biogenesis GTP-binding protein YihA/YsxC [Puia sp.]